MGRGRRNAAVVRAIPLLAGLALLLSASLAFAANPPQVLIEARIVAVSTRDGPAQIWSFNLDGSGGRALTKGSAAHYSPKVSPDGTRIVFTGEDGGVYSIYAMNIDGSGVVRLTRPPMSAGLPAWSPDGKLIAFMGSASAASGYQIWTTTPDGTGRKQLTHLSGSRNASPAFSPDGARIAFASSRTAANGQFTSRIWTMNIDGSNTAAVTAGPGDGYASWIDLTSFLFARTTPDNTKSQILLKTLGGGETPESPANGFYTEPQASADSTRYIATEMSSGGGLFLAWRPLNGDTTQAAAKPVPIAVGGDLYNPSLIFEAAPPAPTPSGGGAAPSVPASPVAAAPSGVVSIAVPPSSNGGPSLNIWEILIGVGIVAAAAGGITYNVRPRPRKKRINKARIEDFAWCRLKCGTRWDRDPTDPRRAFNPKTGQNGFWDEAKGQWIDSKTGEGLTPPMTEANVEDFAWCRLKCGTRWDRDPTDPRRAFNPKTGQNGFWDEAKGQWIDSKTGAGLTPSVWESGPAGK